MRVFVRNGANRQVWHGSGIFAGVKEVFANLLNETNADRLLRLADHLEKAADLARRHAFALRGETIPCDKEAGKRRAMLVLSKN